MPISSMACKRAGRGLVVAASLAAAAPAASAANCFTAAGERHRIDPLLLVAIAKVESAMNARAIHYNANGTVDIGLMQINSSHLPRLVRAGITRKRLIDEPCTSVDTGASILAGFIERHGYTWNAVGAYNAGSSVARAPARKAYAARVWRAYRLLTRDRRASLVALDAWRPSP
ncbi:lytic transglycosylase domain-containing protein [Burkholderia sp. 3C]